MSGSLPRSITAAPSHEQDHRTTPPPRISQIDRRQPEPDRARRASGWTKPHVPDRRMPNTISPRPSADSAVPTRSSLTPCSGGRVVDARARSRMHEHDQHLAGEHPPPRDVGRERRRRSAARRRRRSRRAARPARTRAAAPRWAKFDATSATIAGRISAAPMPSSNDQPNINTARLGASAVVNDPQRVDHAADRERALAADDLPDLAAGDHQRRHHQRVQRDRRLDAGHVGPDVLGDGRDRHVHHRPVERHQELAGGERQRERRWRPTDSQQRARAEPTVPHASGCRPSPAASRSAGELSSIAATIIGSSGAIVGAKRRTTVPSLAMRNFSKFHRMSGSSFGVMP